MRASMKTQSKRDNSKTTKPEDCTDDNERSTGSVIKEGEEDDASSTGSNDPPKANEEDEEVQLAMEMALAAMKNPKMSPDELRKLLLGQAAEKTRLDFVKQAEEKKARQKQKEQEEAQKRWSEQKDSVFSWFYGQSSEEYQWAQEKAKYADKIKKDKQVREIGKAIKANVRASKQRDCVVIE
jgi:hypothetical protein